jgi:hypothetical protein
MAGRVWWLFAIAVLCLFALLWYLGVRDRQAAPEFQAVKVLQRKAMEKQPLTTAEIDRLIAFSRFRHDQLIQARAISGLAALGDQPTEVRTRVVSAVAAALDDPHTLVVTYAASGLAALQAKDKIGLLVPLQQHPDIDVRIEVKKSLKELGYQPAGR